MSGHHHTMLPQGWREIERRMQTQGRPPAGLAGDLRQRRDMLHAAAHVDGLPQRPAALPCPLNPRRVRGPDAGRPAFAASPGLVH